MSLDLGFLKEEIHKLTRSVWSSMVGISMEPSETITMVFPAGHAWGGCVRIQGTWNGAVVVHCGADLLRVASKSMLGVDPKTASHEDLRDTLGELTNITGGNIKAILPGPSALSLPMVAEGDELSVRVPKTRPLLRIPFSSPEGSILVVLHEVEGA